MDVQRLGYKRATINFSGKKLSPEKFWVWKNVRPGETLGTKKFY